MSNEFIKTDERQWLREVAHNTYEMYQVVRLPDLEWGRWFAGGGEFALADYADDLDFCLTQYDYGSARDVRRTCGNDWKRIIAEVEFECHWADFPIMGFATEAEAISYVNELMERSRHRFVTIYHTKGECPKCGETNDLDGGFISVEHDERGPYVFQNVTCNVCGCRFVDVYRLEQTEVWR